VAFSAYIWKPCSGLSEYVDHLWGFVLEGSCGHCMSQKYWSIYAFLMEFHISYILSSETPASLWNCRLLQVFFATTHQTFAMSTLVCFCLRLAHWYDACVWWKWRMLQRMPLICWTVSNSNACSSARHSDPSAFKFNIAFNFWLLI